MAEGKQLTQLVVIGASVSGIDPLSRLVATPPAPFPAPIVVAQHIDPARDSHRQEILQGTSTVPVKMVTEHAPLENGAVYLVPPNRNVEINDHEVRLLSGSEGRPLPSVDLLLGSAAEVCGRDPGRGGGD